MGVKSFLRISGLAVSIGVSALLAGCGSGSSSAVSPPPPPPPTAGISFSPTTLAAGQILSGSIAPMTLTVTSTGSIPLTISGTTISGADASSFTVTSNNCTAAISTGNTCQMVVTFKPTATGSFTATLNVTDNAPGSPQQVQLTGSAITESNSCKSTNDTSPAQTPPTANYAGTVFSGKVMAGSLPVIGSTVKIYAAGTTGNGSAPTLLNTQTTSAAGTFSVPASFTCPYSNSVLYAVSTGGQAGSTGTVNAGLELATVLGTCNSLTGSQTFTINEVTTAATAWSMQQFMSAGGKIGATATNSTPTNSTSGIVLAAGTFANLVNSLSGSAPGTYFPATGTAPTARINQLADLLNTCTASSGATSSACTQLYANTTTAALTPTNTLDAAMNLVANPGNNVSALYTLSTGSTAYAPGLSTAPVDWTLFVTFSGGGMTDPSALSIDSTGRVWVANYFSVASSFTNTGSPVFAAGVTGDNLLNSYGGGVDVNDVMWITNEQSSGSLNQGLGTVTQVNSSGASPATFSSGGLDFPISVSFDTSGLSWIVDYGNSHLTILNNAGTPQSGTTGYTTSQYVFPVAVAVDSMCNAFLANQSSNAITFTSADGTTFGSYITGNGPSGIAVDGSNNVWVSNYYGDSIGLVTPSGTVVSGSGFVGGGIDHPQGIAVDGKGTVWVANYRSAVGQASVLSELAGSAAASPGALLSPATGWGQDAGMVEPFAVAIDASGNLWVTNFGTNTLTEFVGLAAPVKTPLLGPVRIP
jgi:streptogramin lyase